MAEEEHSLTEVEAALADGEVDALVDEGVERYVEVAVDGDDEGIVKALLEREGLFVREEDERYLALSLLLPLEER